MTRIVALLPMKANSTRVPGKNFLNFCGKPLFRWVLDSLLEVPEIDDCYKYRRKGNLVEKWAY